MLPDFAKLKWPFWTRIYSESGLQAIVYMYILYCTYIIHICVYKCICICTCMYLYIYTYTYTAVRYPINNRLHLTQLAIAWSQDPVAELVEDVLKDIIAMYVFICILYYIILQYIYVCVRVHIYIYIIGMSSF